MSRAGVACGQRVEVEQPDGAVGREQDLLVVQVAVDEGGRCGRDEARQALGDARRGFDRARVQRRLERGDPIEPPGEDRRLRPAVVETITGHVACLEPVERPDCRSRSSGGGERAGLVAGHQVVEERPGSGAVTETPSAGR